MHSVNVIYVVGRQNPGTESRNRANYSGEMLRKKKKEKKVALSKLYSTVPEGNARINMATRRKKK